MHSGYQSEKSLSEAHFWSKLTEAHIILIEFKDNLKVAAAGFVPAVPKRTTRTADCLGW